MGVSRVNLVETVQKSVFPDQAKAWPLPTPIPHPNRDEAGPVSREGKQGQGISSGQSLPCGNGSPMLLDLLTFQETMEIWDFIQISKLLNMISNLKREKSKPHKTHRTVGWTQCTGCQCAVPALFDTRGAESHTALALFHFSLSRVWLPKFTTNTFAPDTVLARRASIARRFLNRDPPLCCWVEQQLPADATFPKSENEQATERTCHRFKWLPLLLYSILSSSWQVHVCDGDFSFHL